MYPPAVRLVLFGAACLLGSLLVFLIQPLAGRLLLPHFGGSPGTWLVCLLFFQTLLFAGYLYVHLSTRLPSLRAQVGLQATLLAGATLLPRSLPAVDPGEGLAELRILGWLTAGIGLPYLAVTTGAPLLQRWLGLLTGREPYRLYALSNVGSLLGLLVFPFALEPLLGLNDQTQLWRGGFTLFAMLMIGCGVLTARAAPELPAPGTTAAGEPLRWLLLSLVPSALLLSTTNHLTVDVAPMPLLWIAPLALYLVSFILCFADDRFHRPLLWLALWIASTAGIAFTLFNHGTAALWQQLAVYLTALLSGCMLCHGELARRRPPTAELTRYYTWVAGGGALGGLLVAVVAPRLFTGYFELQLSVAAVFAVLLPSQRAGKRALRIATVLLVPIAVATHWTHGTDRTNDGRVIEHRRNFHGILRVTQLPDATLLTHGRIRHGMQFRDAKRASWPTMYYGTDSAMGIVLRDHHPQRPRRIGAIGLGVGTLAAHGRDGDTIAFYELSADVVDVAKRRFTFLRDSPATIEIGVGDGRTQLAALPPQRFDILVLDAFSSDAVPVHLLTREAFALYARHLAPDGVLLANVSNRHLRVDAVTAGSAADNGMHVLMLDTKRNVERGEAHVRWAVMSRDAAVLDGLLAGRFLTFPPKAVHWTDERSGLFEILKH